LEVSRICLGCMSYGVPDRGNHAWSIGEEDTRPFIKRALEGGINFFDTANRYSLGSSEEILGRAIKDFARRDEVVIATKVYGRMRPGPNDGGLSRKAIMREIDDSLRRLGTDYVDLYQIHRWDYGTPIEETLEALHDIVKAGKVRYIGASSMHAWQFARALGISERHGWTRFVSMQNLVNLLYREEEREMLPLCAAEGIGVIPWSPQARGRLTRDWDYTSIRTETDDAHQRLFAKSEEADRKVVDRVAELAAARGIPRAQVALAWLHSKPVITAPIVGATKLHHLEDALASVNVKLSADEITSLEEPYVPACSRRFCLNPLSEATGVTSVPLLPPGVDFCRPAARRWHRGTRPSVCGRERALDPTTGARRTSEATSDNGGRGARGRLLLGRPRRVPACRGGH
jgi:aryl-alcohol dehydrogenase-like predicted oxidoreductase